MLNVLVNLGARWFGVSNLVKEAENYKTAAGGVVTILTGLAGLCGALAGIALKIVACHSAADYLAFIQELPHDPLVATLGVSAAAIGTGLHQIGTANHHADQIVTAMPPKP